MEKSNISINEKLIEEAPIIITEEDILQDDMRELFQNEIMHRFITFVNAGLPIVFLRSNKELTTESNIKRIQKSIEKVYDKALKKFLMSRLKAIRDYKETNSI